MKEKFLNYIKSNNLFQSTEKVLLAVSGGIDSIAMLHLFHRAGFQTAIAHCNFKLRGDDSDADEKFVSQLAKNYNIPFYVMHFNTEEYADLQKLSIEMAARELRYNWFENLRQLHGFHYIASAHNANDAIETFFINLLRGTGIQGLTGIRNKNGYIIRPLLFAFRNEIEEYCSINKLTFRQDITNDTDKYLRNKIRHALMPLLNELNPEFNPIMQANLIRISDAEKVYIHYINSEIKRILENKEDGTSYISIGKIKESFVPQLLLYEVLKNFGFSSKTTNEVFENLDGETGSTYYSDEKRLIKDRNHLIVTSLEPQGESKFYINEEVNEIPAPIHLKIQTFPAENFSITSEKNIAVIDKEKINFPLLVRRWQKGDFFHPLGMEGIKKVSDFFVDNKLSLAEKENTWIVTSAGEIVWIAGMRLDDRFKITEKTKDILSIKWIK